MPYIVLMQGEQTNNMLLKEIITSLMEDTVCYLQQIDSMNYTTPIPVLSNSTIGQHTRHFIEFFQCLFLQQSKNIINYDQRVRDKQIETNPQFARQTIQNILDNVPNEVTETPLLLNSDYGIECENCVQVTTNFKRELIYNIEHTIHHLAIIKIGLLVLTPHIKLPPHFGIAPSTIKHQAISS